MPKKLVKSFVISLKRRPDRLRNFFSRCPQCLSGKVSTFEAVDGSNLKLTDLEHETEVALFEKRNDMNYGEKGCFLSHFRLWHQLSKEQNDNAFYLIFEDDCVFEENFEKMYSFFASDDFPTTEVEALVYFGGRFNEQFKTDKTLLENQRLVVPGSRSTFRTFKSVNRHTTHKDWHYCRTAHAYAINKSAAVFLVEKTSQYVHDSSILFAVDHFMRNLMNDYGKCVVTSYPLCCYSDGSDTDIQNINRSKKKNTNAVVVALVIVVTCILGFVYWVTKTKQIK